MFCGKCGAQLEDDAKFCPACGAVIEQNTASEKQKPSGSGIAKIMKSPSRMIGVAAVVLVVILAVVLGFGGKSPEKIAAKACETELNQDVKGYYKLLAPPYIDYMVGPSGWYSTDEEFQQVLADSAEEQAWQISGTCGDDVKVKCKAEDMETCDGTDLAQVKYELQHDYDYDADKIKGAAVVTVRITAQGSERENEWTMQISCVKIGGSWYVHRPGFTSV